MKLKIPLWMKILLHIENNTGYKTAFILKTTTCVVYKNLKELEKINLIFKSENRKDKRKNNYNLTKKGKVIKDNLINLNREMGFFNDV